MSILKSKNFFYTTFIAILILSFICSQSLWAAKKITGPVEIQIKAKDGFNLVGILNSPKDKSLKNKVPLVIFLHSLGKSRLEWNEFPDAIRELGVATLTMDIRGHGQSLQDKKGKRKYWRNFLDTEFKKYPDDIDAAIDYIRQQYPEIDTKKIAIIASDISANAAIIAAKQNKNNVKTLILLSPTTEYKGLETRIPMVGYGNKPVLIMVSQKDKFCYKESSELIKYAQGIKTLKVFPYGGNGMDLLRFQPESKQMIIDWIKTHLLDIEQS